MLRDTTYLTTLEASVRSGLSDSALSRLAKAGELSQWVDPSDRRRRLYDAEEIDQLAERLDKPQLLIDGSQRRERALQRLKSHPAQWSRAGRAEAATGA